MSKRECRSCQKIIPYKYKVDGKVYSLQNRKFCLECSPHKGHNTSPEGPNRIKKPRVRKNQKYCSSTLACYKRQILRKDALIKLAGGCCNRCGYSKHRNALCFHHIDPSTKKFGLCQNGLRRPEEEILEEFKKCQLLCVNCHAEIEAEKSTVIKRLKEEYGDNWDK